MVCYLERRPRTPIVALRGLRGSAGWSSLTSTHSTLTFIICEAMLAMDAIALPDVSSGVGAVRVADLRVSSLPPKGIHSKGLEQR